MTAGRCLGTRVGRTAGFAGFIFVLLIPLAFHHEMPSFHIHNLIVPKLAALRIAAAAFLISLAFHLAFEPGLCRRLLKAAWPVLLWFAWGCASFIWSEYTWATTEACIDRACMITCALGAVLFFSRAGERKFAEIAFPICVLAVWVIFFCCPTYERHAPFVNENPAGTFFALAAIAASGALASALARISEKRRVSPLTWILSLPLIILSVAAVLLKSGSSGAILGLLGGWVVMMVMAWRRRLVIIVALLIMTAAFLTAILTYAPLKDVILGPRYHSTTRTRVFFWRGALDMFGEKPPLGRGAGSFAPANVHYQPPESYMHEGIKSATPYAHCFYLQTAVETGAVGVLIFLGVVAFTFLKAGRTSAEGGAGRWFTAGLLGAMSVVLLHGAVGIVMSLPSIQIFFWLCVAAVLGRRLQAEETEARTGEIKRPALRWLIALVPSACAILIWAVLFSGEVPRELDYARGRRLFKRAYAHGRENGDVELLRLSDECYRRATRTPYPTRRALAARIDRARTLNALAVEPGETTEKARLYSEAIDQLRYVRNLSPGMANSDMNLGFVMINLGCLTDDKAAIADGCRLLVEHLKRNPFNIPEQDERFSRNRAIFRALRQHLKDPAVKRELIKTLLHALELVGRGGADVPRGVEESAREIRKYAEELAGDPDVRNARRP